MTIETVADYLEALKQALAEAPRGLVQDALTDAEEHLRAALAQQPEQPEAAVLAEIIETYGTPEQVAAEYHGTEAASPPGAASRSEQDAEDVSLLRRFFGVVVDRQVYAALLYLCLAPFSGALYGLWVTVGLPVSAGLLILIIGAPIFILFVASVRFVSHVEGRIVETLLGVRMPRRLPYTPERSSIAERIKAAFTDVRTWTAIIYMAALQPLAAAYWFATGLLLFLSFLLSVGSLGGLLEGSTGMVTGHADGHVDITIDGAEPEAWLWLKDQLLWLGQQDVVMQTVFVVMLVLGVLVGVLVLHLVKAFGWVHGQLAERLLVRL